MTDPLCEALQVARNKLIDAQHEDGYWLGRLSSSALSTATAVSALSLVSRDRFGDLVTGGAQWLTAHQNADGGWGDTPDSPSNVPTTMLVEAALQLAGTSAPDGMADWLSTNAGVTAQERIATLRSLYGRDRTFAVPILVNCALAGQFGVHAPTDELRVDWRDVPPLPFELAAVPRRALRLLRLHVVSYALPALVAIGQLIHMRRGGWNPLRRAVIGRTLRLLESIQPESGGFLEAVPLTSFVTMSLAGAGRGEHPVAVRAVEFLTRGVRPDGSWPIDSDLRTWLTTMAIDALADDVPRADALRAWLLAHQQTQRHAYTDAAPGGWAWTSLPGGVPDADDTAGALLALRRLGGKGTDVAARDAVQWLIALQNADGGWPTFCRGWGRLPFDRSAADLTAHAVRALAAWDGPTRTTERGLAFLRRTQRDDGAWLPLWFGSQHTTDRANPVYGTARVLPAWRDLGPMDDPSALRGVQYLLDAQSESGAWGGDADVTPSMEETALAVAALAGWPEAEPARRCGAQWLADRVMADGLDHPAPIGLYFAQLWYSEALYPTIWTVAALRGVVSLPSAHIVGDRE